MDLNNGVAGINIGDQLDFAIQMASAARNHYDYALWSFKQALGSADPDAVEGARAVLHLAIQEVNAADAEVRIIVRRSRCIRIRINMRQLGMIYGRFAELSKQHGANFRANHPYERGLLAFRNQFLMELRNQFDALYWDFSSVDPGSLPRTYVDLEERDRLFEDRSIYWSTLADDVTKPWFAHI